MAQPSSLRGDLPQMWHVNNRKKATGLVQFTAVTAAAVAEEFAIDQTQLRLNGNHSQSEVVA